MDVCQGRPLERMASKLAGMSVPLVEPGAAGVVVSRRLRKSACSRPRFGVLALSGLRFQVSVMMRS
jgi:hypothetical protein